MLRHHFQAHQRLRYKLKDVSLMIDYPYCFIETERHGISTLNLMENCSNHHGYAVCTGLCLFVEQYDRNYMVYFLLKVWPCLRLMFPLFPVLQSTSIRQAYIYAVLQPIKEGIIIKSLRLSELWKPSSLFSTRHCWARRGKCWRTTSPAPSFHLWACGNTEQNTVHYGKCVLL